MNTIFDDSIIRDREKKLWGQNDTPLLIVIFIAIYFLVAQIIPAYLIIPVNVIGSSMEPTLESGDRVLLLRQGEIRYGDIIVLYAPDVPNNLTGNMGEDIIKRVMGRPGDTVWFEKEIKGGITHFIFHRSYIKNGMTVETALYNESYVIKNASGTPLYASENYYPTELGKITLGEGEYFVLGDNRPNSTDSRSNLVGKVKKEQIKGKALLILRGSRIMLFNKIEY